MKNKHGKFLIWNNLEPQNGEKYKKPAGNISRKRKKGEMLGAEKANKRSINVCAGK